jgi:2-polyprenyl-3-methyl-5-hydroxy-6-metoxy-1,4-benzoquinol methylase
MRGWNKVQKTKDINSVQEPWLQGYFSDSHYGWDGETWNRNFAELRARDLALMCLGDVNSKKVLDVGCGDGTYAYVLSKLGAIVSGQDLGKKQIEFANARKYGDLNKLKGEFICGNANKLMFNSNTFDCVFSADFFEHIDKKTKQEVLREIYRVLVPGGLLVIKTPNLDYLKLVINLKKIFCLFKGKSPNIHIAHTNNNPDNEPHGLTNFTEMKILLEESFFHEPIFQHQIIARKGLSKSVSNFLYNLKIKTFSEHLIISSRKSIFIGVSDSLC